VITQRTVFTNGCFDLLHAGHIELLKFCASFGRVVVGINSDASIKRLKGATRPIIPQTERLITLNALRYVDEVIVFEDDTPSRIIDLVKPDLIVKGGDYSVEQVVGCDRAEVKIFPLVPLTSTSLIIQRIIDTHRGN
jgi:D-beta-D-heptose 7-phosphate kinase/D-beta-D-heptose 1-phosphate adenosyltransferase